MVETKLVKVLDVPVEKSSSAFARLLHGEEDWIRRDVFNLILPEDTESGALHVGTTVVYPGCRTKGHAHPDREEVYYFIHGKGIMVVDGKETEVHAGDTFYVPYGPFHTTRNPYNLPLEFLWMTIQKKSA